MAGAPGDLPEAATRRFAEGAFTSGLTVPDFAACLQMGLEPVGFVQGFCVMQWQWYGIGSPYGTFGNPFQGGTSGYSETWQCPHGFVSAEHRGWGQNYEQSWIEDAWQQGFRSAYDRMIEEASSVGAHGVVGLVDASERLSDMGVLEFRVQGTAVRVKDGRPSRRRAAVDDLSGRPAAGQVDRGRVRARLHRRHRGFGPGLGLLRDRVPERGDHGHVGIPGAAQQRSNRCPRLTWPCAAWPANRCGAARR